MSDAKSYVDTQSEFSNIPSAAKLKQESDELQQCFERINALNAHIVEVRNSHQSTLSDYNEEKMNVGIKSYKPSLCGEYEGHFGKIYSLDFGCDSRYICTASQDGLIIVWNAFSGSKQLAIPLKSSWVMTCALSPTPEYQFIASGGLDNAVTVHKCNRFTEKGLYRELSELSTNSIDDMVDNNGDDNNNNSSSNTLDIQKGYISGVRFLDNTQILCSCGDSNIALWDLERTAVINTFEGHYGDVMSIDINKDDKNLFVSGSIDRSAKIWDIRDSEKCVSNFSLVGNNQSDINNVKWFIDEQSFLTGLENGKTLLFDLRSCQQINEYVYNASTDPNPQMYIATGNQNVTSLLDTEIGSVSSVAVSKSGHYIFVSYDNGKINMFDSIHASKIHELNHPKRISSCAVAPNGYALAAGCFDSKLRIYA